MILLVAAAAAEPGALVGVVFDEAGRPLAGVEVRAGGETTRSGPDGGFGLVVEPGRVAVELRGPQAWSGQVEVRAGLSTELLVSLGPRPHAEIEAPVAEAVVAEAGPPGQLRGRIVDEAGQPLAGVRLFVRGVAVEAVSDRDGRFSLDLPSGRRDLSAIRAGYATLTEAVELAPGGPTEVAWRMERAGVQLAELTVRAPKLEGGAAAVLDERQEAASVADVLGAEQMSRAGDSDAAAALRRVTGLTVIGGKYVYVRGLGDRYSATLLNGSALPSPEPEKRVVPLDLFPTSLLEAVVIQKTFSPDRKSVV